MKKRLRWIIGLCIAIAVVVRILVFLDVKSLPDATSDGLFYQEVAQKIAAGTWWQEHSVFSFSPLYVLFLAAVQKVAGSNINAVRFLQLMTGLGSIALIFLIARAILNRRAALIALCLAALYVPFVFFEVQVLGITLVLALMLLSLYLLVTAVDRGNRILLALAGYALGLASLGAPNLIAMAAPVAAWLLFFAGRTPRTTETPAPPRARWWKPGRGEMIRAAIFVVAVIGGILPVTLWNYHASGQLVPISSHGGINFYIGNNPKATGYFTAPAGMEDSLLGINIKDSQRVAEAEAGHPLKVNEVSSFWFHKGLGFLASDPMGFTRLMCHKVFLYFNHYETPLDVDFDSFKTYSAALRLPLASFGLVAVLGLAGLVAACRSFRRYSLFILAFATYSATVVAFFVSDRYRLPAVPFLIFFSALGIDWAWERLEKGRLRPVLLGAALLVPAGFFVYAPVGYSASPSSLYFNLAVSYVKQKDLPRAKVELQRCIQADAGWLEARFQLAAVDHELNDNEGAWEQLVILDRVHSADVLYLRAQMDAASGLLASARELFNTVISLNPNNADARKELAAVEALAAAETPEARHERGRHLQEEGMQMAHDGRHERAIANFHELEIGRFEGIDPALAATATGFSYTQLGRFDEAEQAFESALQLSPRNPTIHKNLAILEVKRGDRMKAELHFQEFARLAPNDPQISMVRDQISAMPSP